MYFKMLILLIITISGFTYCQKTIFDFDIKESNGNVISLSKYKGKVLIFTNVASECWYTDGHYKMYAELEAKYGNKGFHILAFPCNDFLGQEPQSAEFVSNWAKNNYACNFSILQKISFYGKGEDFPDVWKFILDQSKYPMWNFWKYLIGKDGKFIDYFSNFSSQDTLESAIIQALNAKEEL